MIHENISIIVAIAQNFAIGKNNDLLFHLPNDLKRFKQITTGYPVIMGRNTLLSLPKGALPNRRNIVITDNPEEKFDRCEMVFSVDEAIEAVKNDFFTFVPVNFYRLRQGARPGRVTQSRSPVALGNAGAQWPDKDNPRHKRNLTVLCGHQLL